MRCSCATVLWLLGWPWRLAWLPSMPPPCCCSAAVSVSARGCCWGCLVCAAAWDATVLAPAGALGVPPATNQLPARAPLPAAGEAAALLDSAALLPQLIGLPLSTVLEAEAHLAGALGGDAAAVSALRVLQLYLERLGYSLPVSATACWSASEHLAPACSLSAGGSCGGTSAPARQLTPACASLPSPRRPCKSASCWRWRRWLRWGWLARPPCPQPLSGSGPQWWPPLAWRVRARAWAWPPPGPAPWPR